MDINRNQYFMLGVVIVMLGIQFRFIESVVLTEKSSQFLSERLKKVSVRANDPGTTLVTAVTPGTSQRVVRPPKWLSWALISVGVVLVLHSLAMKKPD